MEWPTFNQPREAVSLEAFGRDVMRRREQADAINMPRNSGVRRTDSKRALLGAIEASGGRW